MQIYSTLELSGKNFDPLSLGYKYKERLENIVQVGFLSKRGHPSSNGSCHIKILDDSTNPNNHIGEALSEIKYLNNVKNEVGIESISLWISIYYEAQCNLQFDPVYLSRLG